MITKLKRLLNEQGFTQLSSLVEFQATIKEFPRKKVWYHDPICKYCCLNSANGIFNLSDERLLLIIDLLSPSSNI